MRRVKNCQGLGKGYSTIGDSAVRISYRGGKAYVFVAKVRAAPASLMFYAGLSVESFDDILYVVGDAASTLTYSGAVGPDLSKKRSGN